MPKKRQRICGWSGNLFCEQKSSKEMSWGPYSCICHKSFRNSLTNRPEVSREWLKLERGLLHSKNCKGSQWRYFRINHFALLKTLYSNFIIFWTGFSFYFQKLFMRLMVYNHISNLIIKTFPVPC